MSHEDERGNFFFDEADTNMAQVIPPILIMPLRETSSRFILFSKKETYF